MKATDPILSARERMDYIDHLNGFQVKHLREYLKWFNDLATTLVGNDPDYAPLLEKDNQYDVFLAAFGPDVANRVWTLATMLDASIGLQEDTWIMDGLGTYVDTEEMLRSEYPQLFLYLEDTGLEHYFNMEKLVEDVVRENYDTFSLKYHTFYVPK